MEWFSNKNSKGIRIAESGKFLLVESGILVLESGIQLKESRIILTTGIQNPSSTDKDWNPVGGIRNRGVESIIQDCLGFSCNGRNQQITKQ